MKTIESKIKTTPRTVKIIRLHFRDCNSLLNCIELEGGNLQEALHSLSELDKIDLPDILWTLAISFK